MGRNKLFKFAEMEAYSHAFDASFPVLEKEPFVMKGNWNKNFFKNNNPVVVELGCGKGEYTVELGKLFPDKNFIGIDVKGSRMWVGASKSFEEGMSNVAFVRTHIEFIDRIFAQDEISEIWLTFSDPQMKKVRKRLTSTYFMNRYREVLKDNGIIHVKTDSNFLYTYTDLMILANHLPYKFKSKDLYRSLEGMDAETQKILGIQTYYESQWRKRGIDIKYIRFALPHIGELVEPEVEIELDEYRSYNRNKRSSLETSK